MRRDQPRLRRIPQPIPSLPDLAMRSPRLVQFALLFACAVMGSCTPNDSRLTTHAPTIDTLPNGAIHVVNTGPTAWADTNGWRLVLERTIAPAPGEPGELGEPRDIVVDSRGNILVADYDEGPVIKRFGPDGTFLGQFGRRGSGPGEFQNAALMITRDTLVIHDSRQARTSTFTADGTFLQTWTSLCCEQRPLLAGDGVAPVPGMIKPDTTSNTQGRLMSGSGAIWYALDGSVRDTTIFPPQPEQPVWRMGDQNDWSINTIPYTAGIRGRFAPDGRYYWGLQGSYRIVVTRTGHDTLRIIEGVPPTPATIPESLRVEQIERYHRQDERWRAVAKLEDIPTTWPMWSSFVVDQSNHLWVLLPGPRGEGEYWDVFDPDGVLLGRVPAPFDQLWRTFWGSDRVYQVTENPQTELPEIRVWRVERGG